MSGNKVAPHVARAIGAVQAKNAPAGRQHAGQAHAGRAAHLAAGVAAGAKRPAPAAPVQAKSGQKVPAAHVQAALAAARQPPPAPPRPPAHRPGPAQPKPAAAGLPVKPPASAKRVLPAYRAGAAAVQTYKVLGSDKIWTQEPNKRPWGDYPYVLLGKVQFVAQERPPQSVQNDDEAGFLEDTDSARIMNRYFNRSIRLSDDNQMAIEDSDLRSRQPKAIFLAQNVLDASNQRLKQVKSPILLVETKRKISAITGWYSQIELKEVVPTFNDESPDQLPQNCNAMAGVVMGQGGELQLGEVLPARVLLGLLGKHQYSGTLTEKDLQGYARGDLREQIRKAKLNQHATPVIGEAFMIGSANNVTELYDQVSAVTDEETKKQRFKELEERVVFRDYFDQKDKKLNWPYHYGAVVAISGSDRITLENYARGDNRMGKADPRWFFQMYGAQVGQSFHEANRGENFVNPVTMVIRRDK